MYLHVFGILDHVPLPRLPAQPCRVFCLCDPHVDSGRHLQLLQALSTTAFQRDAVIVPGGPPAPRYCRCRGRRGALPGPPARRRATHKHIPMRERTCVLLLCTAAVYCCCVLLPAQ